MACNDHGGFAIAWNGNGTGDNAGVYIREFNADGTASGAESLVNTTTGSAQRFPTVVAASSGYVVGWSGNGTGDEEGVFLQAPGKRTGRVGDRRRDGRRGHSERWDRPVRTVEDAENGDSRLTFQVVGNTNPSLFDSVDIGDGRLAMIFAADALGSADLTVRATDPGGLFAETTFTVVVEAVNDAPVIAALSVDPDPAVHGAMVRLEGLGVMDDGAVAAVAFYRDSDGNGILDASVDQLLGEDTDGAHGWAVSVPTAQFAPGRQCYFAQATDDQDMPGNVAATTSMVEFTAALDNSQSGYTESGPGWGDGPGGQAFLDGSRRHATGSGENTAAWVFSDLPAGQYKVYATWPVGGDQATDAPFSVFDGGSAVGTEAVNQQLAPAGEMIDGWVWQFVGSYWIGSGQMTVELSDDANGVVAADAIRIVDPPATLYWDTNGSTAGFGNGTGTWNTSTPMWNPRADGTGTLQAWNNANGDTAVFSGGSAGTVTISGTVNAGSIVFNTAGYTVTGGTLSLSNGTTTTVTTNSGAATINSVISGGGALEKVSAGGWLFLGGGSSNTYTGGTTINSGSLIAGKAGAWGQGGST